MSYKLLFGLLYIPLLSFASITFLGITEDSSIDKNSFLCPDSLDAEGLEICQNRSAQALNFTFNGPRTLQLFNNQQYWAQQKYRQQQLLIARGYKDTDLDNTLKSKGWSITGGFSVIITTDPLVTSQIDKKLVPAKGQTKLVAQLWYNGDSLIQLWAQDVVLVSDGQNFTISLSSSDSTLSQEAEKISTLSQPKNIAEVKEQFLQEVALAPINIVKSSYSVANGSPKNIKIVLS